MTISQSTSLWFWLLGVLIFLHEWVHRWHPLDLAIIVIGYLVLLVVARLFIWADAQLARWIIHPLMAGPCLLLAMQILTLQV